MKDCTRSLTLTVMFFSVLSLSILSVPVAAAQESYLRDVNGDGEVRVVAFGDSITRGVGDFTDTGVDSKSGLFFPSSDQDAGYPLRLEQWLDLPVSNQGVPGEVLTNGTGAARFANVIPGSGADVVIFFEGSNDAIFRHSASSYFYRLQSLVNITRAVGAQPIMATIPIPTGDRGGSLPYIRSYNDATRRIALFNNVPLADLARGFRTTCQYPECDLYNLPEGLHPNTIGYDVIAEIVAATLFQIDIFAAEGASLLESALGLEPGSVRTKPDAVVAPPTESSE